MINAQEEVDRMLITLRNKIREKGFTQLKVQADLKWGRSYISQLLTKQKSLRVEQVLQILDVIGIEPAEFFAELFKWPVEEGKSASAASSTIRRSSSRCGASWTTCRARSKAWCGCW